MNRKLIFISVVLGFCLIIGTCFILIFGNNSDVVKSIYIDLDNLLYNDSSEYIDLKRYSQDDFESFLNDYKSGNLPDLYVTEFVFDGVGMYKTYDLDDFIDGGNDLSVDVLSTIALNINSSGNYVLSGCLNGMVLVNTNDIDGDINISLNNVNIDSSSKKIPAIYVYNKDINYTEHKVLISAMDGTINYVTGGKFKKVSLVGSDQLNNYSDRYSGEASAWYSTYTNYYGVYTSSQVNDILFAKVTASSEDLADGDPYYFYKGAGAISSDIDLYFEGAGYLEVDSKSKEGIETKGNLIFSGGIGDYVVNAYDDCLNTTTKSDISGARNDMVIDVNSMSAIVDLDSDEGDALDSNGSLTINGGTIIAIAHPGADAGLDSENGTYINGGTIIATGDMYDEIKSDSKQSFIGLSFSSKVIADDIITLVDSNNNVIFSYSTDRDYSNLVYSSSKLVTGDYSLYKNGIVSGENFKGFYSLVDEFSDGIILGYTSNNIGMMPGNQGMIPPEGQEKPNMFNDNQGMNPPDMPDGDQDMTPPNGLDNDQFMTPSDGNDFSERQSNFTGFESANKVFSVNGISNLFGGIVIYSVE